MSHFFVRALPSIIGAFHPKLRGKALPVLGAKLARLAEVVGPTGIKIAQVASYRSDLVSTALLGPLQRVQDQVRPPPASEIKEALRIAFPGGLQHYFRDVDERPIAAGSIAVVIRAWTHHGEPVAIKVLRPGVLELIDMDLACLRVLIRGLRNLKRLRSMPVVEVYEMFGTMVRAQCDLHLEAQSATMLASMVGREVAIPVPHPALSRSAALVMQYVPSLKITNNHITDARYERGARALLRDLYRMIFIQGVVHGDLHPGNIGLTGDDRVVLYDFGLVARLSKDDRTSFRAFFLAVITGDAHEAAIQILRNAKYCPEHIDEAAFTDNLQDILSQHIGKKAGEFLVLGFVAELFQLQRAYSVLSSPGFASAIWALAMFEGLVRDRCPNLDFQSEAKPFVAPFFHQRQ